MPGPNDANQPVNPQDPLPQTGKPTDPAPTGVSAAVPNPPPSMGQTPPGVGSPTAPSQPRAFEPVSTPAMPTVPAASAAPVGLNLTGSSGTSAQPAAQSPTTAPTSTDLEQAARELQQQADNLTVPKAPEAKQPL